MIATRKLRPLVKWHGGKTYLARRIIALFGPHETYVEPFAGGLSVLLNKTPAQEEVANDLNGPLIWAYRQLVEYAGAMIHVVSGYPYDREAFANAKYRLEHKLNPPDSIDGAADFIVVNRMSRGGLGKDFAWSDRLRGGQPGDVNAWQTMVESLPEIVQRFKGVRFLSVPAVRAVRDHDGENTLHYVDPPYLPETRTVRKAYAHEMTRDDHAELLGVLRECKEAVYLSGYRNPMYDEHLAGWTRHEFDMPNHSGQGKTKQRRVECVWTNRETPA